MKVAAIQMSHAPTLDGAFATAARLARDAAGGGAELAVLPEYFFAPFAEGERGPATAATHARQVDTFLRETSRALGIALAGNLVAGTENVVRVYDRGALVGEQAKVHPMPREAEAGIRGGDSFRTFTLRGITAGTIVCADVFYPEASRILSLAGARLLLNPVMSPYREADPTKAARESVYVARAWDAAAFVVKAGGFWKPQREGQPTIAGRSLITAPWGTLARYRDDFTEEVLVADLDFGALAAFREQHRGFKAREPKAYRSLVE
ncbi:MAG: carbon-nitrogen hydrolase family protein [Thermoplasmatota archaeon]